MSWLSFSSTTTTYKTSFLEDGDCPVSPLIALPYEVQSYIIDELTLEDTVNLARTCKALQYIEREERICNRIAQSKAPWSREVRNAKKTGSSFAQAIRRVAKRRDAFASASPFSVAIVALADDYAYLNGMLCYTLDSHIRLLDLHNSATEEVVVSIPKLLGHCFKVQVDRTAACHGSFEILSYCEGILACLFVTKEEDPQSWLIVINVRSAKLLLHIFLDTTEKIFVRTNAEYLYYGTHSEIDQDNYKKWVIKGFGLRDRRPVGTPVYLKELAGSEVGQTVCFEIIQGYFYAVSNQTSFEVEEIDWTSFYHCVRFPIDSPCKETLDYTDNRDMWRRQHAEGPIDDRWSSLSLEIDETSGELKIYETRREWHDASSISYRTYYNTPIIFPSREFDQGSTAACSSNSQLVDISDLPDEPIVRTLTSSNRPNYMPARERHPASYHPGDDGATGPSFIISKTPVRHYHASSQTFIDIVDDPLSTDWQRKQRLRLRAGSRKPRPPTGYRLDDGQTNPIVRAQDERQGELDDAYFKSPIRFWPEEQPPSGELDPQLDELYRIMNPPSHLGNVTGIADDRSILYVTGGRDQPSAVVFVSFDPGIRLEGLKKWKRGFKGASGNQSIQDMDKILSCEGNLKTLAVETPEVNVKGKGVAHDIMIDLAEMSNLESPPDFDSVAPCLWTEKAMYTHIGFGFDFGH